MRTSTGQNVKTPVSREFGTARGPGYRVRKGSTTHAQGFTGSYAPFRCFEHCCRHLVGERRREVRPVGTVAGEADTSVPPATSPGSAQPAGARLGAEAAYASRFLVCSACSGRLALFSFRQRRGDGGDGIFRRPGTTPAVRPILLLSRDLPGAPDQPFLLYNLRCRHFYRDCIHRGDLTDLQEQGSEHGSLC